MKRPPLISLVVAVFAVSLPTTILLAQTVQNHVHSGSHSVMPFELSKTQHIFKMTEQGGVESVVVKDPVSAQQLELVREHLSHEAAEFQKGNYGDPAALHGPTMPGLSALREGASRIKVSYAALPNGAAISFETSDLHLLTEVHRWFGAQLSEHGADARAE